MTNQSSHIDTPGNSSSSSSSSFDSSFNNDGDGSHSSWNQIGSDDEDKAQGGEAKCEDEDDENKEEENEENEVEEYHDASAITDTHT